MFRWAYDGVNTSIPRNVGPECLYYITPKYRLFETLFISVFIIMAIVWGFRRLSFPKNVLYGNESYLGQRILLCMMSIVIGMELGFKFTSRTVIYILNPCHITTAMQLYLLTAKPSPMVTTIFRIQLNLMNGPVLAYLFPETESRKIFADQAMYYIQHGLMLVIPYYLLRKGGPYTAEPLSDMSWSVFSYGLNTGYHFWVLQGLALPSQVNLSHMLCAAVLDPFEGQFYRIWAFVHQALLCPLLSKLICYTSDLSMKIYPPARIEIKKPNGDNKPIGLSRNGHMHRE